MSDLGDMLTPPTGGSGLLALLEERIGGLLSRYRELQKTAEELRSRLESAEAHTGALQARCDQSDDLRAELGARVGRLITKVSEIEGDAAAGLDEGAGNGAPRAVRRGGATT
jgi:chromosome segregation ATPase